MNDPKNFICFIAVNKWETYDFRHQLEPLVAKGTLIIVEAPLTIISFKKKSNWKYIFHRNRYRLIKKGIVIVKPLVIIPSFFARRIFFLKHLYLRLIKRSLKKYMSKSVFRIVMFLQPYQEFYVGHFNEMLSTFDYNDKFDLYPNKTPRQKAAANHNLSAMLKKVDLVFTTSYLLKKESKKVNDNSFWIPNCVSQNFIKENTEIPEDIRSITTPIVGFVGNINDWLDFTMINYLADSSPNITFVFIGGIKGYSRIFLKSESYKKSLSKPNITYLGYRAYSDLYHYIKVFDVCAIYYIADKFKSYVHPNKIYMYLAAGKPIVMTSFLPEAKKYFKEMVYIANSYEAFNESIKIALNEKDNMLRLKRTEFAERNNNVARCKRRFNLISKYIENNILVSGFNVGRITSKKK